MKRSTCKVQCHKTTGASSIDVHALTFQIEEPADSVGIDSCCYPCSSIVGRVIDIFRVKSFKVVCEAPSEDGCPSVCHLLERNASCNGDKN